MSTDEAGEQTPGREKVLVPKPDSIPGKSERREVTARQCKKGPANPWAQGQRLVSQERAEQPRKNDWKKKQG